MTSFSWTMQDVPPPQRFAYWREAVCRTYLPLEPERLSSEHFDGELTGMSGASLHLSRVRTLAAGITRTRGGISAFQDGSFFANLQISGEAVVEQHGVKSHARVGDIVLVDTDAPFSIRFEQGCDLICATIPGDKLRRHLQQVSRRPTNVISGRGAGRLAAAYLGALQDIPEDFELVDDLAADQLCALLSRAATTGVPDAAASSRRHGDLQRILAFIVDELHNPLLSAKYACRHLEMSRSHLFAVLAGAGITFASHIRQQRLHRSLSQIRDPRYADLSIGEIARRWGFSSHETFSRAFSKAYGRTPGACRPQGDQR